MANDGSGGWPAAGRGLLDELKSARGRVALIAAEPVEADTVADRIRADLGIGLVRLGRAIAEYPQPPTAAEIESACGEATVITDLDVLLWPELKIAPLHLLAARARRRPTIAVWPGVIVNARASYSALGRPDHHDLALRDVVVLRPAGTRFPDEVPFTIERTPR